MRIVSAMLILVPSSLARRQASREKAEAAAPGFISAHRPKAIVEAKLVERKVSLVWMLATGMGGRGGYQSKGQLHHHNHPTPDNQEEVLFIG